MAKNKERRLRRSNLWPLHVVEDRHCKTSFNLSRQPLAATLVDRAEVRSSKCHISIAIEPFCMPESKCSPLNWWRVSILKLLIFAQPSQASLFRCRPRRSAAEILLLRAPFCLGLHELCKTYASLLVRFSLIVGRMCAGPMAHNDREVVLNPTEKLAHTRKQRYNEANELQ